MKSIETKVTYFLQIIFSFSLTVSVSAMQPCPYFFISLPLLRE